MFLERFIGERQAVDQRCTSQALEERRVNIIRIYVNRSLPCGVSVNSGSRRGSGFDFDDDDDETAVVAQNDYYWSNSSSVHSFWKMKDTKIMMMAVCYYGGNTRIRQFIYKCVDELHPPICSNKRTSVVTRRRTTKDLLNDSVECLLGDEKSVKKQSYNLVFFLMHVMF